MARFAQRVKKVSHGHAIAFPGAFGLARPFAFKPTLEMRFDGNALQSFAHVGPLHNVLEDFAGLGFGEITVPGELGRPLVFHRHGQSRLTVALLGAPENSAPIRPQEGGVPVGGFGSLVNAGHNSAKNNAKVNPCRERLDLSYLLSFVNN